MIFIGLRAFLSDFNHSLHKSIILQYHKYGDYKMMICMMRTLILYLFITVAVRLMGKRQIADMQPNELVVTLLISEIAAIPLQDPARPLFDGIISIFILVVLEIIMSVLPMKSNLLRKWLSGNSVVIIRDGKIDQRAMKKVRMTVLDLIELLRIQNIFDLSTVAFAVLEVNGTLSVLQKSNELPLTKKDVGKSSEVSTLPLPVISDGKIIKESLKPLALQQNDLNRILKGTKIKDVFLMTLDRKENSITVLKEKNQ